MPDPSRRGAEPVVVVDADSTHAALGLDCFDGKFWRVSLKTLTVALMRPVKLPTSFRRSLLELVPDVVKLESGVLHPGLEGIADTELVLLCIFGFDFSGLDLPVFLGRDFLNAWFSRENEHHSMYIMKCVKIKARANLEALDTWKQFQCTCFSPPQR